MSATTQQSTDVTYRRTWSKAESYRTTALGHTIKGRGHQKWHCNAAAKANFQVYLAWFFFIEPVFSRKWCGPTSSCEKLEHRSMYILRVRLTRTKAHSETIEHTARPERVHPVASCSIEEEYFIDFRAREMKMESTTDFPFWWYWYHACEDVMICVSLFIPYMRGVLRAAEGEVDVWVIKGLHIEEKSRYSTAVS